MKNADHLKWIFFSLTPEAKKLPNSQGSQPKLIIIFLKSFIRISGIYLLQFLSFFKSKQIINESIILGSQAPHHHLNVFRFLKLNPAQITLINSLDKLSFTSFNFIGIIELYKELIKNFFEAKKFIVDDNTIYNKEKLAQNLLISLSSFTYFSLLFYKIKKNHPNVTIYTGGAELASLAAIKHGLKTNYVTHGLTGARGTSDGSLSKFIETEVSSERYPAYSSIFVYSEFEKEHLQRQLPNSSIHTYQFPILKELSKTVILFLDQTEEFYDEPTFIEIIKFFESNNLTVIGKEHPTNQSKFPKKFCNDNNIALLGKDAGTGYEVLLKQRPMFTIGWPSTSLCESLNLGVIPICITDDHPFFKFENFYPFQSKTLSWNKDALEIESLLTDQCNYDSCLAKLRKGLQ